MVGCWSFSESSRRMKLEPCHLDPPTTSGSHLPPGLHRTQSENPLPRILQLPPAAPDFTCFLFYPSCTWLLRNPPKCTKWAGQASTEKCFREPHCPFMWLCDCSWLTFPGYHRQAPAFPFTCWHITKSCWHDTAEGSLAWGVPATPHDYLFTFFQCEQCFQAQLQTPCHGCQILYKVYGTLYLGWCHCFHRECSQSLYLPM